MVLRLEATADEVHALRLMLSPEAARQTAFDPNSNTVTVPDQFKDQVDAAIEDLSDGMRKYLLAYAASRRFDFEGAGIVVDGIRVATNRAAIALVMSASTYMQDDPEPLMSWKGADGSWHRLNGQQVVAIAKAVAAHVAKAFRIEASLVEKIEAKTITSTADIDAAFPLPRNLGNQSCRPPT